MNREELLEHFGGLIDDEALEMLMRGSEVEEMSVDDIGEACIGKNINVRGRVVKTNGRRKVSEHEVATAFIKGSQRELKISFWDSGIDLIERIKEGYEVRIINCVPRSRKGGLELEVNRWSEMDVLSEQSTRYFFPLDRLPTSERVNVEGMIMEKPTVRSFLRDNNRIGVVGSTLLSDGTNSVRVVAWDSAVLGFKEIDIYQMVRIYDCRVRKNINLVELHCDNNSKVEKIQGG